MKKTGIGCACIIIFGVLWLLISLIRVCSSEGSVIPTDVLIKIRDTLNKEIDERVEKKQQIIDEQQSIIDEWRSKNGQNK